MQANARSASPIGVFDSGVGGLSVLRAIRAELPDESVIYCADSRYAPYGERSEAFIIDRTLAIAAWLIDQGVKALVVACNTATTIAVAELRAAVDIPIIGVEPGVKPAVLASQAKVVGVLATAGTIASGKFQGMLASYADQCTLICTPGVGLVDAIEGGDTDSPALYALLEAYLHPMMAAGADTLALGCTHYPFLLPLIEQIAGTRLNVIDNSLAVARQVTRQLDAHGLRRLTPYSAGLAEQGADCHAATLRVVSTGDGTSLGTIARKALQLDITVAQQDIPSRLTLADASVSASVPV